MNFRSVITALLLLLPFWCGAQPICQITHYDEFSGLSQQSVKQVAQDGQGKVFVATERKLENEGVRNVSTPEDSAEGNLSPTSPRPLVPSLSEADEAFMCRVMDFVEKHLSDSNVNQRDISDLRLCRSELFQQSFPFAEGCEPKLFPCKRN